jgi:hypothetical protein
MKRWLACIALVACSSPPAAPTPPKPASFEWPAPTGWKKETIPFPLDFAPGLAYRGTEELRFAPGFFDPSAPGSWSYAFVWFVDKGAPFTAPVLEQQLRDYFVGLTKAVAADAKDGWQPALDRIEVHLTSKLDGTIRTIDAFKTRNEVNLIVHATAGSCSDKQYLLVAASPKPAGDPMWTSLDGVTSTFTCR